MELAAFFANGFENVQDGFFVQAAYPARASDSGSLTKQTANFLDLAGFKSYAVQWLRLRKRLATAQATETADFTVSVPIFGEVFGFAGAAYAVQLAFLGKVG